jgi:hypothetical protein
LAGCSTYNLTLHSNIDGKTATGKLSRANTAMTIGLDEEVYAGKPVRGRITAGLAAPAGPNEFSARLRSPTGRSMLCEYTLQDRGGKGECTQGPRSYDLLIE